MNVPDVAAIVDFMVALCYSTLCLHLQLLIVMVGPSLVVVVVEEGTCSGSYVHLETNNESKLDQLLADYVKREENRSESIEKQKSQIKIRRLQIQSARRSWSRRAERGPKIPAALEERSSMRRSAPSSRGRPRSCASAEQSRQQLATS